MYQHPYPSQPPPPQQYQSAEYAHHPQHPPPHASRERDDGESHQHTSARTIGDPLSFADGQFSGQLIRAQLTELQKADLGRKYARKDRRPLDPPPVVQLRLFRVENAGTEQQSETEVENYDEISNMGLICHVDLFPVPGESDQPAEGSKTRQDSSTGSPPSNTSPSSYTPSGPAPYPYTFPAPQPPYAHGAPSGAPQMGGMQLPPMQVPQPAQQPYGQASGTAYDPSDEEVVHWHKDFGVVEGSKCTEALAGTTFVQASNLDYKGNKVLMFVFSDLAVKMEGNFILRYRCFDLFSKVAGTDPETPVWAECYGGQFRVYSTKEFPGLRASTDLTKHLSYFGVRLNLRETERKRRKKVDDPLMAMATASRQKGKRRPPEDQQAASGDNSTYDD